MPDDGKSDKATEPTTRSGKQYTKNAKPGTSRNAQSELNFPKDKTESEGTMDAESVEHVVETRETIATESERDPTMAELMKLLVEMRGEIGRLKSAINPQPEGVHPRLVTTMRSGDTEVPVTINTGSDIGNDDESENGEPIPARRRGGNGGNGGNGAGVTLRVPRSGWVKDPFEELKFYGETDKQNPIVFLRRFENIARHEGISREQRLYDFKRVMKGAAKHWIEAINPSDIEHAKTLFRDMYWGRAAQKVFKKHIFSGQYQPNRGTSMSEYALNIIHQCQTLKPRMTDDDIIEMLEDHFEESVAREIRPSTVTTLTDLIVLLKRIESTRNKKPYEGDLYRFDARNANRTGSRTGNIGQTTRRNNSLIPAYRKGGYREPSNVEDRSANAKPKTRYAATNQSRSYNPNVPESRYYKGQRFAYPRRDGRPTITITDVTEEEAAKQQQLAKPSTSWYPSRKEPYATDHNKPAQSGSRSTGFQKKRLAAIKGEEQPDDQNVKKNTQPEVEPDKGSRYEPNLNIVRTKRIIEDLDETMEEAHRSKKFKEWDVPIITVRFKRYKAVRVLVDTGAQVSALSKELFQELQSNGEEMAILPIKKFLLRGAFTEKGAVIGNKVSLSFQYQEDTYSHELYLVEKMAYRMILGIDFLTRHRMQMNLSSTNEKERITFTKRTPEANEFAAEIYSITIQEAKEALKEIFEINREVFQDGIGRVNNYEHEIKFTSEKPYKKRTYPIPEKHLARVTEYMREIEESGIVTKTSTQFVNPLVVVIKKNGEVRLCLDARELNKRTKSDHAQPPTIDDVFRQIGQRKVFSTIDIAQAFWQIPLTKESKQYTGFMFKGQTYVFNRMPFGLKTAGGSFTRAMDRALGDEASEFTIVYLDDILIASSSLEDHLEHIKIVLSKLKAAGYRVNKDKCEFLKDEIKFLGHTFSEVEAEINLETRQAIQNFQRPRTKKQIQSFLGLVNWDRRFIKNMARIVRPMEELLQKGKKFLWGDEQQRAFTRIKSVFIEAPNLFLIRPGYKFGIYVDAATTGLGARLYQYRDGSEEKCTVAYASRTLKGAETRYTITELEGLALTWALRKWHTLLLGRHVRVHTDHKALQFLSTCVQNNQRIARWFAFLQEFELDICHIPGKENVIADALSRSIEGSPNEGEKTIALIRRGEEGADPALWIQAIKRAQENDEEVQYKLRDFPNQYYVRDELARVLMDDWDHDKIMVPEKLTWKLVQWIHRLLLHYGTDKIESFTNRYFTAKNLARVVRDVVASCTICQATKYYTRQTRGVEYYELPDEPGKVVSLDIFGPLPLARNGYKYILVAMDQFTKHTKFYPMKSQKLDDIMEELEAKYFPEVGVPHTILTDNGGQFVTARWARFSDEMNFEIRKTSPYNPQSNPVERVMRELGRIIRAYASHSHASWVNIVPKAERVINETVHASTGFTPNELQLDENNNLDLPEQLLPVAREEKSWQRKIEEASTNLKNAALKRKKQSDKHPEREQYLIGDLVWLKVHRRSDASRRLTRKIHLVYDGPYQILQIIRRNAYLLGTLDGQAVTAANSRQLKPHRSAKLSREDDGRDPRATEEEEEGTSEGDDHGDQYLEADPEDVNPYEPEDSPEELEEEESYEDESYEENEPEESLEEYEPEESIEEEEPEESPEDSIVEVNSTSNESVRDVNTYNLNSYEEVEPEESPEDSSVGINSATNDSDTSIDVNKYRLSSQNDSDTSIEYYNKPNIDRYLKPRYYTSSDEIDSDDERIQEKLRRKRYLKQKNNELKNSDERNLEINKNNNAISKINKKDNDKIYPVKYNNDGVNQTATYHSEINKPGVKGRAKLTLHRTNHSEGFHFESRTQTAEGYRSTVRENGEERCQRLEQQECLPEITMGAFYVEETEDIEVEDENNNFLIDPDTIDLTKEDINLGAMGIERVNGEARWNDLVNESSHRYIKTMQEKLPEIKITKRKGGNGEEHNGEHSHPEVTMYGVIQRSKNHAKADTVGATSILRELLERASSDDIHSVNKKKEEALDLKKKKESKEINSRKKKEEEARINANYNRDKWKNIMTMIHKPAIRNINLACGGNCILRGGLEESEISSGETVSMHSGTDSQYERISPDASPERNKNISTPKENTINNITRDTARKKRQYCPKDLPEGCPKGYPKQKENYPKDHPERQPERCLQQEDDYRKDQPKGLPKILTKDRRKNLSFKPKQPEALTRDKDRRDNLNFIPKQPEDKPTGIEEQQEAKNPVREARITCKIKKIKNKKHTKPYYRKRRTKLQTYRIFILKKQLGLLKTIIKIANNETKAKNNATDRTNPPICGESETTNQKSSVRNASQSERGATVAAATSDLDNRVNHDRSAAITRNRETYRVTASQGYGDKVKMESEEARLLRVLREKVKWRDEERARRKTRVEYLESLIQQVSDDNEISSDEDRKIEDQIEEIERLVNDRDRARTTFRVSRDIYDDQGRELATFDATVNMCVHPRRARGSKPAILVALLMKDKEIEVETKVMGDVNMGIVRGIQFKIPYEPTESTTGKRRPEERTSSTARDTGTETASPMTPKERGETHISSHGSGSTSRETSSVIDVTPVQKTYERRRDSTSRPTRKRRIISDSEEENLPERKKVTRRKPKETANETERRAKDGRRLVDLSNRIRDERGRIRGYKPGAEPSKVQRKKPMMKIPSVVPPLVTPELRIAVQRLADRPAQTLIIEPELPPVILQDQADNGRARRIRPSSPIDPGKAENQPEEPRAVGSSGQEVGEAAAGPRQQSDDISASQITQGSSDAERQQQQQQSVPEEGSQHEEESMGCSQSMT